MENELKKLLRELNEKDALRKDEINKINADMARIDLREETEKERFIGNEDKPNGIYEDIDSGVYYHRTEGYMQKIIDEELIKIKEKYDVQREELNQKLDETRKQHEEEKLTDYKKISSAIKDYHIHMVLEVNKENKKLSEIESERNEKLEEIDKLIDEKDTEKNHLVMKNRKLMNMEESQISKDIRILGDEIEKLKLQRDNIEDIYKSKLKTQSDTIQYYNQQKDRASKFLGSIILSEKSINEIYELLFQESENKKENKEEVEQIEEQEEHEQQKEQIKNDLIQDKQRKIIPSITVPNQIKNKKFYYRFSAEGISYEGSNIEINELLNWYDANKDDIVNIMKRELGEKEKFNDFLEKSDKFIYLSMLYKGENKENDALIIDEETRDRLREYYSIWTNPKKQEENNIQIEYNLKGLSAISRFFKKSKLTNEQVANIRENAFLLRNRKDVKIEKGLLTKIEFYIKDRIENSQVKLLNAGDKISKTENRPSWLLTKEQQEQANEPVQQSENHEKEVQQPNIQER